MKQLLTISILFIVCSCKQIDNAKTHTIKTNPRLLSFYSKLVYTVDDLDKLDTKKYQAISAQTFNQKTDTIKYLKNKIYVSCLTNAAGSTDYTGDIKFNSDTITLLLINMTNVVCAEEETLRVVYEIENKENKKYIILKY